MDSDRDPFSAYEVTQRLFLPLNIVVRASPLDATGGSIAGCWPAAEQIRTSTKAASFLILQLDDVNIQHL